MKIHQDLTPEYWFSKCILEQMSNVGADVGRAINWRKAGNPEYSQQAFFRALELLDLTRADPKNRKRLKELCRVRYLLVDYLMYDNIYKSTDEAWEKYFYFFNYAYAVQRGK